MKNLFKRFWGWVNTYLDFFKASEMSLSSIAVAYHLLLSLFPLLLIVANALPFFHINVSTMMSVLKDNLPEQLYEAINPIIENVMYTQNTGLLSFSILVALWTLTKSLTALQMAMNKAYGVYNHRDFIVSRVIGVVSGFAIFLFMFLSISLATFGQIILEKVHAIWKFNNVIYWSLHSWTVPAFGLAVFFSLAWLYWILPNVKMPKIRYIMPGTVFSTFVLVFLSSWIAKYVSFAIKQVNDFKLIGSLVVFVLMIWFIFIARVIIVGAIFNATFMQKRYGNIETRRGEIVEFIKDYRKDNK